MYTLQRFSEQYSHNVALTVVNIARANRREWVSRPAHDGFMMARWGVYKNSVLLFFVVKITRTK
jgi:hypothetical protein